MKNKISSFIGFALLIFVSLSCECERSTYVKTPNGTYYTTAKLGDLKFGTTQEANPARDTFKPRDEIYTVAKIVNSGTKQRVRFYLYTDDVKGQKLGTLVLQKEVEDDGSSSVWWHFSRREGIPVGRYKVEAVLMDEEGKTEIDRKAATFNIEE